MRYLVKQKLIAIGDDFSVVDENGKEQYYIDGYGFSFGKKLSVLDSNKREVALIKKSLFSLLPQFKIFRNGRVYATVRKKFLSIRPGFIIRDTKNKTIDVTGKLIDFEYYFRSKKDTVAVVSKKWFTITDSYAVDIPEGSDTVLILCAAIIIDLVLHDQSKRNS